jgi:hypothetical protein
MAKSIDQQIKDTMAKKVVGRTTEIYKAVVLELYKRITANSLQVGIARADRALLRQPYDRAGADRQNRSRAEPGRRRKSLSRLAPDQCRHCPVRIQARANHLYRQ